MATLATTAHLAARIAEEAATLPAEKLASVLDYVRFMKQQSLVPTEGDDAWERIIGDPNPRPKLDAFMRDALAAGSEPLDFDRL